MPQPSLNEKQNPICGGVKLARPYMWGYEPTDSSMPEQVTQAHRGTIYLNIYCEHESFKEGGAPPFLTLCSPPESKGGEQKANRSETH